MRDARMFSFERFELYPERQLLMRDGTVLRLGGRALELLTALVERPGELMSKNELLARVWPTTTVDEGNLKVNVAAARRALSDVLQPPRFIATVSGRGYRFVAPVKIAADPMRRSHEALVRGPHSAWSAAPGARLNLAEMLDSREFTLTVESEIILRVGDLIVTLAPGSIVAPEHRPCRVQESDKQ